MAGMLRDLLQIVLMCAGIATVIWAAFGAYEPLGWLLAGLLLYRIGYVLDGR